MIARIVAVIAVATGCASPPRPAAPRSPLEVGRARIAEIEPALIALRHDLHAHPELAGQERRTAEVIARWLRGLGLPVREGVGGHGVVAVIEGARPGPVVAYRADLDAVASDAVDPAPFPSVTPGVRHLCGHDVHAAVGVGVAEALVAARAELAGTVVLLFQPAEETAQGARAMLDDGALRDPAPEAIFAVHSAPLPAGTIGTVAGPMLAALAIVDVTLAGDGDLEAAAAAVAAAIQATTNVSLDGAGPTPAEPVVAIPFARDPLGAGQIRVRALLRTMDAAARARAVERLERAVRAGLAASITATIAVGDEVVPATINDAALVAASLPPLRRALGDAAVLELDAPVPFFSEDFAFFLGRIPGAMYWLGVADPAAGITGLPHSPDFAADDRAIALGATAMTAVLLDYLAQHRR